VNEIVKAAKGRLSRIEAFQIRAVRRTFEPGMLPGIIRWLQRNVGARWIGWTVSRISHFHHVERLPPLPPEESYIVVCNHRSIFDMFLVISELVRRGIVRQRILFPVKSEFFYDNALGMLVNGMCSFFAMYPPIFRSRAQGRRNVAWDPSGRDAQSRQSV
jgi:1-acyl-sn-glycerol-3-phosphate acyltransferase